MNRVITRVVIHPEVLAAVEGGIAEGVRDTAQAGKERALEIARGKFRTTRHFAQTAFATAFVDGKKIGGSGRNQPSAPDTAGIVAYYGYDWFVARFYETGTARQLPRPSLAPSAAELGGIMPGRLRDAAKRRGL